MTTPSPIADRPCIVSVNLTTACNLACTYCHAIHRTERLPAELVEATAIAAGQTDDPVLLVPFGGEPLVAWPAFRQLVDTAEASGVEGFLLCSNGLLASDEQLDYFARHHIELTVSWDGVPEAHDQLRIDKAGRGTSEAYAALFARIRQQYRQRLQVRITVGPESARHFAPSVRYLLDTLGDRPGVKICFMPVSTDPWSEAQLQALDDGLAAATDHLLAARKAGRDVALAYNECIVAHELGEQILFHDAPFEHACLWGVKMLGVDTDGGVYPCHTVIELRQDQRQHLRLGHVRDGYGTWAQRTAAMPPPQGNPYHTCFAWNLVRTGDPYDVAEVYRRTYRAFVQQSVRVVAQVAPHRLADARDRADQLLERAAHWDTELKARPRPGR